MEIPDPHKWLPDSAQWPALLVLLILTAGLLLAMQTLDVPLKNQISPRGIVSFELATNYEHTQKIMTSWTPEGRVYAALSLGLDYLFLIIYALFISLSCTRIAKYLKPRWPFFAKLGLVLGWTQFLAAFLDAVENFALIKLILGSTNQIWQTTARWCAMFKFSMVGVGLFYILVGIVLMITIKNLNSSKLQS